MKTIFLYKNINIKIYIDQPINYIKGNRVYLLKKVLYNLKQSPRI